MPRNKPEFEVGKGTFQGHPVKQFPVSEIGNMFSWQESGRAKKPVLMSTITDTDFGKKYYTSKDLENSIKAEGQRDPIQVWVDPHGNRTIGDGHHRYVAAKNLGLSHINAVVIPHDFSWEWAPKKKKKWFGK